MRHLRTGLHTFTESETLKKVIGADDRKRVVAGTGIFAKPEPLEVMERRWKRLNGYLLLACIVSATAGGALFICGDEYGLAEVGVCVFLGSLAVSVVPAFYFASQVAFRKTEDLQKD